MAAVSTAPATVDELRTEVVRRHGELSKRLQQIGRYVLDHPNEVALETLAVIASRCGVQPSAIVRFAKTFGYDGASQMQKLLRDSLLSGNAALGYSERVRQLDAATSAQGVAPSELLEEFVEGNTLALASLLQTISAADIESAVGAIVAARTVYVAGFRRSFPVASYLAYSLLQAGKQIVFVDGVGGLSMRQVETMTTDDLLISVSFHPYSEETVAISATASQRGANIMAITDSLVSPIAKISTVALQVRESEVRGFRALSASMCLAQAIVINYAFAAASPPKTKKRRQ